MWQEVSCWETKDRQNDHNKKKRKTTVSCFCDCAAAWTMLTLLSLWRTMKFSVTKIRGTSIVNLKEGLRPDFIFINVRMYTPASPSLYQRWISGIIKRVRKTLEKVLDTTKRSAAGKCYLHFYSKCLSRKTSLPIMCHCRPLY